MSQRILGLDVGRASVKAVRLETTFSGFEAVAFASVDLPPDDGETPWLQRLGAALRELVPEHDVRGEVTVTAVPGDRVTTRLLTLPFSRRREIDLVIGPELEDVLPFPSLDEVVYDYRVLGTAPDGTSRIFVAIAERAFVTAFVETLKEAGLDPRVVTVSGLSKADLIRELAVIEDGPLLVCDVGHSSTTYTVVRGGKPAFWRTSLRGTGRVDEALREVDATDRQAVSDAISGSIGPLVRDVKQTVLAAAGAIGEDVTGIYLCGGGSRLGGLDRYLEQNLGIDAVPLEPSRAAFNRIPGADRIDSEVPEALGLALRAVTGAADDINLRQGDLAFSGELSYLRGNVIGLAFGVFAILVSLAGLALAQAYAIRAEEKALLADLQAKTKVILGTPYTDFEAAAAAVARKGTDEKSPAPSRDAYRLLYDTSTKIGDDLVVDIDLFEVDLDRERVEVRGRTASPTAVQQIVERLGKVECFSRVETERNERGTDERQVFHLTVKLEGC